MSSPETYPLVAIVTVLREAGISVSVGDLLDGIEALAVLDAPFVAFEPIATSKVDQLADVAAKRSVRREQLIWLVQTLWARTDQERATVRRVLGKKIAPAPTGYVLELGGPVTGLSQASGAPSREAPRSPPPDDQPEDLMAKARKQAVKELDGKDDGIGDLLSPDPAPTADAEDTPRIRMSVPEIDDDTLPDTHLFQLEDQPSVDELALANVWRRFRRPRHYPDGRRIDIEKSVEETVRKGGMLTIVNATRRINQARLTLMLDASSAMAPWTTWRRLLATTSHPNASRLDAANVGYFATVPGAHWFDTESLTPDPSGSDSLEDRLKDLRGSPMLVFGEAGAARAPTRNIPHRLFAFLNLTLKNEIRPLVWINPMRRTRWQPFFQTAIMSAPHAEAFELSHTSLIAAIDRLREEAP